ncbi:MAG: CRTAC1 family protein [Thermoanaerobaculia bacterium]
MSAPHRRRRLPAIAPFVLLLVTPGLTAQTESEAPSGPPSLAEMAEQRLTVLQERKGTAAPEAMLLRNLSRYFARYTVPTQPEALSRLLGTLERMTDAAALDLWRQASARAASQGQERIGRAELGPLLEALEPAAMSPWAETVFFPLAPDDLPVAVEVADLEAFRDTGLVWQRLLALVRDDAEETASLLPLSEEGASILALGLETYDLLLLRLGGEIAAAEHAEALDSRHLRDAAKAIAERAAAHGAAKGPHVDATFADVAPGTLFQDRTDESGIRFRHVTSRWLSLFRRYGTVAPTFSGGGVTAGDVDGDRLDDLLYCGGTGCSLYRNLGDGTFDDVTDRAGIGVAGEARQALLADFDNDGRPDLFITYARDTNRLFHNRGDGTFADVTDTSGLGSEGLIAGPATSADFDGDGLLDLYVGFFGDYLKGENPWSPDDSTNGLPNRLYLNRGSLRFEDVTDAAGVAGSGWTQALSHCDCDRDGDQDLYVANDFGRNELYLNRGDATFEAAADPTGAGDRGHGMNVSFADLNRDALPDILITNIWSWEPARDEVEETNTLLLSNAQGGRLSYRRTDDPRFLGDDTGWSWGALFLDSDLDADDDLLVVNGFTDYFTFSQMRRRPGDPDALYAINNGREPNHYFRNDTGLPSVPVDGTGLELPGINSRGAAALDYDRDGDVDVAISTFQAAGRLFENVARRAGPAWLEVDLEGDPQRSTPRQPFGATVTARAGDLYVWRALTSGGGYLSQSSSTLHFGLGTADRVTLEVRWPNGETQELAGVSTGQRILVRQGASGFEVVPPPGP